MDLLAGPAGWSCLLFLLAGLLAGLVPVLCPVSLRLQDRNVPAVGWGGPIYFLERATVVVVVVVGWWLVVGGWWLVVGGWLWVGGGVGW